MPADCDAGVPWHVSTPDAGGGSGRWKRSDLQPRRVAIATAFRTSGEAKDGEMIRITDAFLGEHGVVSAELDNIEEMLNGTPELQSVHDAAVLLASALRPHVDLEDELLFCPALARLGQAGPAPELIGRDQDEIRWHVGAVGEATCPDVAIRMLRRAVQLTREHFIEEERIGFPLAERLLGEEELLRRGAIWATRRSANPQPLDRIGLRLDVSGGSPASLPRSPD
jgi:hypothetical protein